MYEFWNFFAPKIWPPPKKIQEKYEKMLNQLLFTMLT